jgi:hypothetical protein
MNGGTVEVHVGIATWHSGLFGHSSQIAAAVPPFTSSLMIAAAVPYAFYFLDSVAIGTFGGGVC